MKAKLNLFSMFAALMALLPASPVGAQTQAEDCTIKVLKVSELRKVKVARWRPQSGTPFGVMKSTNVESPPQPGHVWLLVSGKLECAGARSGLPLPAIELANDSSETFSAIGFTGATEHNEEAEFTALEGLPSTARMGDDGRPLWGVVPSKDTGIMTLFLSGNRFESGKPDVDISLLFAVPKSPGNLYLRIRGKQVGKLPR